MTTLVYSVKIFDDSTKFKKSANDPAITRLTAVQKELNNLLKRGEIKKSEKKVMQLKSTQIAWGHGLPKTHDHYKRLLKFRNIFNTARCLPNLLNPVTENEYMVQDFFLCSQED